MSLQPHTTEDQLIDLLNGLLSPAEKQAVMAHLGGCAECENLFRTMLRERESAKSRPGPRISGEIASAPRSRRRRSVIGAAVVAAAVAAFMLIGRHPAAPAQYWIQQDMIATVQRGEDEFASKQLTEAFAAYARHDATRASQLLRNVPVPGDEMLKSLRLLLLASAELNAERVSESLADLERLGVDTLPPPWRSEARWVQYLALRDSGDGEAARSRLESLREESGRIGEMARKELTRTGKR